MADTKALFTQRLDAARTALTEGDDPAAAGYLHSAIVAARSDHSLRRELASALFQLGKLSRKFGRAGEAEAEPLLAEALVISERIFGRDNVALAPVLSELARLHIHRSQHARAEDVLKRLLAIAQGQGDENADVATALAGLAVVRRKLGDDAAAEALFRDALRIREKVLEPSHMVTVVTLEHLSETCAARGNLTEALALLRRGLATREVVLGPGHATVQAARSRVAELELQVAVAADTATAAAVKLAKNVAPEPPVLRPVLADVVHSDVATDDAALADRRSTIAPVPADSPGPARKKRTVLYSSVGAGAVAIAIAGMLMLRPRAGGGSDPVSSKMSAAQRTAAAAAPVVPATRTESAATGAAAAMVSNGVDSLASASATPAPSAPVVKPDQEAAPESAPLRLPRVAVHVAPIKVPRIAVPSISMVASVDSIARSPTERQRASDTDRTGTGERVSSAASVDVDIAVTPAKIIGRVPEPRFPDALLRSGRRDGEVVVRFVVNQFGSVDVASMIVERSDHELFTAAVRDILPSFRFDPARTRAPESKPVASWVSVPFRFTTKK